MIIKNASIYTEDHTFVNGNAVVENGRFVSFSDFSEQDAQIVDAQGLYMIPGLVDIHFHGWEQTCATVQKKHWISLRDMKRPSV